MAWKHLDLNDLRTILSEDELSKLDSVSLDSSISAIVNDAIDMTSDMFRGALLAKGYEIDTREHYSPPEYRLRILQEARAVAWSRFPNSNLIAVDEIRREQAKQLAELLKNPYIQPSKPEWEHSSKNPDNPDVPEEEKQKITSKAGSITLPFLRYDEELLRWRSRGVL